jgi:uncharacterized protein YndB with AHSA1/START domain
MAQITGPREVRFERLLPGPIERVWAYLTESEKRGRWLARGETEPRVGGRVELQFLHRELSAETSIPERFASMKDGVSFEGRVTRYEPPRLLSYTWAATGGEDDQEVVFELSERDGEVLLVLTHRRLPDRDMMVNVASGWHAHLGILADRLNDREPRPFWTTHAAAEQEYGKIISAAV